MLTNKEYESYRRIGTEPHRSYYIPFAPEDKPGERFGIVNRQKSSRFVSLDGTWGIKAHTRPAHVEIDEEMEGSIPVPACVQMHGYDQLQYLNSRYPFPYAPPYVPHENPTWHYRRRFTLDKREGERYYLNFEGVDSAFYLYVNGRMRGFSQISHATSEFDITDLAVSGENTLDVVVLKWCASSYLEDQDKLRFSGIFRSVYILCRPERHLTDYRIVTTLAGKTGHFTFKNESDVPATLTLRRTVTTVPPRGEVTLTLRGVKPWTAECPTLYPLRIEAEGEVIYERVGFREVTVDGCVFKINGTPVKLRGVNRHDFNCKTGATVTLANLYEDVKLMKWLNVNAVRTSHYPNMPEFYALCDAHGIYVMDEADLEAHGAVSASGRWVREDWSAMADNMLVVDGVTDRHAALVERDKNRPSVIIWSLGNESSYGEAYIPGTLYIRERDNTRPIHYEGTTCADPKYKYCPLIDLVSHMYPSYERMQAVLDDPEEGRPYVLCEYTHAMGNSTGDIAAYWEIINKNPQCMGAFVWEWADHAILTKQGFRYGGDFGEPEHDGNFCCDGLLTPDRKLKSAALEMRAVYGGIMAPTLREVPIPATVAEATAIAIEVDEDTGCLTSIKRDGCEVLAAPARFNILRYIDNDRRLLSAWNDEYCLPICEPRATTFEKTTDGYMAEGYIAARGRIPALTYAVRYTVSGATLTVDFSYKISDYVKNLPRVGLELCLAGAHSAFAYVGLGAGESYCDKRAACEYGYFESTAEENYCHGYIRPQESGSHADTRYLRIANLLTVTADAPYSFSYNPYTTSQLYNTLHDDELPRNDYRVLCLDIAMRGIGSHSCGPLLPAEYELPREGRRIFTVTF